MGWGWGWGRVGREGTGRRVEVRGWVGVDEVRVGFPPHMQIDT